MKDKLILFLTITLIILAGTLIIFLSNEFTGKTIGEIDFTHTYTIARCNSTNFCQDYEVKCKNKTVLSFNPITGSAVQFPEDWEDSRENNSEDLCS